MGITITYGAAAHPNGEVQTTDDSWTDVLFNNSATGLVLETDKTYVFEVDIVARRTNVSYEAAGYKLQFVAENYSDTCSIVGSQTKTVITEDDPSWDVQAAVSGTSLKIQVLGAVDKTILWSVSFPIFEVSAGVGGGGSGSS